MSDDTLPVVSPAAEGTGEARVVGVLLAAGTSSRFGDRNKLLATLDGVPVVRRAAQPLIDAGLRVVAVVGHDAAKVRAALPDGVTVVENPDYADGQSTSVRAGVRAAVDTETDAVIIALGDMPSVSPATVGGLVRTYETTGRSALAAAHDGTRGNPVLFDRSHVDALTGVSGDRGGRDILLGADDAALVETGDPGVKRDVDRPADLETVAADRTE